MIQQMYSRTQLAKRLGCSTATLDRHVREGKFPAPQRVLGRPRWSESDIQKHLDRMKKKTEFR